MLFAGALIVLGARAYISSAADAEAARIRALIGDAAVLEGTGSAEGFGGTVSAKVRYSGDVIVGLELSGDSETPDIGGPAMISMKQAIIDNAGIDGVDIVSGATYTSRAVLSAVKSAMGIEEYVKSDSEIFEEIAALMLPESARLDAELLENVLEVRESADMSRLFLVQGVGHYPGDPFKVAVLLDSEGAVLDMSVVYSRETDGFGTEVLNPGYWSQYKGASEITRKASGNGTKIDVVSGATETSVGLYDCVKAAFAQYAALQHK